MHVKIESIDQKLMLDGSGNLATFLTLELPTGDRVSAQVEPVVAQALIELATNGSVTKEQPPLEKFESVTVDVDEQPGYKTRDDYDDARSASEDDYSFEQEIFSAPEGPPEEETPITWADLPEAHLSSRMKHILTEMGVAPVMPASSLVALVDQITERMLEAKIAQQEQPEVGKVQRPGHLQVTRAKTVPKDDAGYPIVSGVVDRDPGEVATFGTDEDGIPQG